MSSLNHLQFFYFHDAATPEIYTLSYTTLFRSRSPRRRRASRCRTARSSSRSWSSRSANRCRTSNERASVRSEEHTSELQSQFHLVCRLLLEKKKIRCCAAPPTIL